MPSFDYSSKRKISAAIEVSLVLSVLGLGQSGKLRGGKKGWACPCKD